MPTRPFGFDPSRLHVSSAARSACNPNSRKCLAAMGGIVGLRPGLLRQVVPKRAVLDAGGSRLYVTKDGSPTRHRGSLWSIHATPQARGRNLRQEAFSLVVGGGRPCPRQGASR
ncbi:hypothetical protein KVP09_03340 [Alcaligenaceae bacterium CGII-47]|nr:hypothetical protein [Alcaligenaceae bacterium CGII-47]